MGLISIILSLCCLSEDPDDSAVEYSSPAQIANPTPSSVLAQPLRTTPTLNEFGTPGDLLTPKQIMQQLYGGTGSIRSPLSNLSIRQPGHPCFIPPRIVITAPTVRGSSLASQMGMMGLEQDEKYLEAPRRPRRRSASQRSRASSFAEVGRRHVAEV